MENSDIANALQNLQPESIIFSETISPGQSMVVGGSGAVAATAAIDEEEDAEKSFRITFFENKLKTRLVNIFSKNSNCKNNSGKDLNGKKSNGHAWPHEISNFNLESFRDEENVEGEDDNQPIIKHLLLTWKSNYFIIFTEKHLFLVDPKLKLKILLKQNFQIKSTLPLVEILNNAIVYGTDSFVSLKEDGSLCYISVDKVVVDECKASPYQFRIITSDKKGIESFQMNSTKLVCRDSTQKILVYDLNEIKLNDHIPKAVVYQFDNKIERFYLWNNSSLFNNKYQLSQYYYFLVKSSFLDIDGNKETELLTLLCMNDQVTIRKVAEIPLLNIITNNFGDEEQQNNQINQVIFNEKFLLIFFKSKHNHHRQIIYSLIILDKYNNVYLKNQLTLIENA